MIPNSLGDSKNFLQMIVTYFLYQALGFQISSSQSTKKILDFLGFRQFASMFDQIDFIKTQCLNKWFFMLIRGDHPHLH